MKKIVIFGLLIFLIIGLWWAISHRNGGNMLNPMGEQARVEQPYDKYSFERIAQRGGVASKIQIDGYKFYYQSEGRKISGEINIPTGEKPAAGWPVVVMARGYVDKEVYKTGIGTHPAASIYVKNGYLTLAPDFSGYGESDPEPTSPPASLGSRLVKPVEILDLLASLKSLPQVDLTKVYLWGHSNGGQVMLSVSEIVGMKPLQGLTLKGVVLWAPVSKPFPYNILYYTDEADDQGKWLRGQVSEFERNYDVYKYSLDKYLDKISLPIQLHQGTADESVPKKWSDTLVESLKSKDKRVTYYVYPGADHNLKPGWDNVVTRDVEWFQLKAGQPGADNR